MSCFLPCSMGWFSPVGMIEGDVSLLVAILKSDLQRAVKDPIGKRWKNQMLTLEGKMSKGKRKGKCLNKRVNLGLWIDCSISTCQLWVLALQAQSAMFSIRSWLCIGHMQFENVDEEIFFKRLCDSTLGQCWEKGRGAQYVIKGPALNRKPTTQDPPLTLTTLNTALSIVSFTMRHEK